MTEEKKYPIGGYAPGSYLCHCGSCDKQFMGDKRAFQCAPCAVADKDAFDKLTPQEQEEFVKKNIEIYNEFLKSKHL